MPPPRDIKRNKSVTPIRKSARLQEKDRLVQQSEVQEQLLQLPSPTSITPEKEVRSIRSIGVQLHPLTRAKASTGISQPFQSRSKAGTE